MINERRARAAHPEPSLRIVRQVANPARSPYAPAIVLYDRSMTTYNKVEAWAAEAKAAKELRRVKRRVQAGVCPCCNRTFTNLALHMATKHKDAAGIDGRIEALRHEIADGPDGAAHE